MSNSNLFLIKKNNKGSQKKPLFVVVGKVVSKKATERNCIKRKLRYILRPIIKDLNYDIVIIAKKGIVSAKFKDVKSEILYTLKYESR